MIDFAVAKRTKLRQKGELDFLFNVSYAMTNAYLSDRSYPRGKNRKHIMGVVSVLLNLLRAGKLPLAESKDFEARKKAVEKINDFIKQQNQ